MDCLTEILKNGVMSDDTRDAVDQLEADLFESLKDAIAVLDRVDDNCALQELADRDETVKELLIDLYDVIDNFSACYNLQSLEHNRQLA